MVMGGLLALFCGLANAGAAALEKHEGQAIGGGWHGWALLARLATRGRWLAAMALSAVAWAAEAAALALAPVPLVTTARSAGRGFLVVAGRRWLGERYGALEVVAWGSTLAGSVTTALAVTASVQRAPLGAGDQLVVATVSAAVTFAVSRCHGRASGIGAGVAVGVLFAATGIFTKAIGDAVAVRGAGALGVILAMPGLWSMCCFTIWAQGLLQQAFLRANAASVAAASAAVSSVGLVVAGFALFGEAWPRGWRAAALVVGVAASVTGTALLAAASRRRSSVDLADLDALHVD